MLTTEEGCEWPNRSQLVETDGLNNGDNFVCKRQKLIFNTFSVEI